MDLLGPHQLAPQPNTKRRTELPPHDSWATKKVPGLEVAAVDRSLMTLASLTAGDSRNVEAYVAGPAALLVAKAFKLDERIRDAEKRPDRPSNKDAGDVYRIMAAVPVDEVAAAFTDLRADTRVSDVAAQGLELLHKLFGAGRHLRYRTRRPGPRRRHSRTPHPHALPAIHLRPHHLRVR